MQPAWVLHHRPYRETSALLELLTEAHGRIGAVAKGARRAASRWRGLLQPFSPLLLSWSGGGELVTITGAEAAGASPTIPGARLMSAYYANELLLRLLQRNDPQRGVFIAYASVLADLAGEDGESHALRLFEKRLLDALGYGLSLTHDAITGQPVDPAGCYAYRLERGPQAVGVAEGELVFAGSSLLGLARERLDDAAALTDARRLLRAALDLYLGDRPLRTREVRRALRRRTSSPDAESTLTTVVEESPTTQGEPSS
jgi:DNA repair protein RecO (recombination protein O)